MPVCFDAHAEARRTKNGSRMSMPKMNIPASIALAGAVLCSSGLRGQVPTKCVEIESILVDACISETDCPGSTEGMNEMVRFITGPAPIALDDLQFTFFSSTFRGITQDATTATLTSQLNASIQGCGQLLEPSGGVIPPGSRVIFVTSTAMCVQANPFTALSDTLYIIFQTPGNSQGHFKNNDLVGQLISPVPAAPLMRWLRLDVGGTACGDTATYDANQLVNIYGTYGGLNTENDGATVEFAWPGQPVATYVNYGCQAPFTPTLVSVVSGGGPIVCGASTDLVGSVSGDFASLLWQGGGGTFSDPNALNTSYTPGGGDSGDVELSFCAITDCGDTICSQVQVSTGATPNVIVSGDTTLCGQFATTVLTASGADTYLWSTGATGPSIVAAITGPMDYWVVGTNACGSDTGYISPRWMHTTTWYQNVSCHGAADGHLAAQGTGGALPYTYLWSTGSTDTMIVGLAPGYYSYTVTDADGCSMTGGTTITEPPLLTATVGGDTTICPGGTAILQAFGAGGSAGSLGTYYYAWSPEGPVVSPTETTVYTVVVSDLAGCETLPLQVTVTVPADQAVTISSTPVDGCAPHCITFTASSSDANSFTWDFGDGNTASDNTVEHCYATAGQYSVNLVVQLTGGCPDVTSSIGPFTIHAAPEAHFTWSPAAPTVSDPQVQFTDLSVDASTWAWHFGDPDGSVSTDPSPAFTFSGEGCYPVSLLVMNSAGCADSTQQEVCVLGKGELTVPNIFSPNNDGRNDVFRITGGDLSSLEVHIFNRWGQQVALLERINQVWDGRSPAGEVLSEGTYFYTLRARDMEGKSYDLSGTITLVR